jgi:hypothetical protein
MATDDRNGRHAGTTQTKSTTPDSGDPRDTDHPTGVMQAADNVANDPSS